MPKGKGEMQCPNCKSTSKGEMKVSEKKRKEEHKIRFDVVDANKELLPKTKERCPECQNEEAYHWEIQTRAGDEPATRFYKCTKCKHVWRDYS